MDALKRVASTHGKPMAQVALAWLLKQPAVTAPLVGATRLPQLDDALSALELTLSDEDLKELSDAYVPVRQLGLIL